MSGPADRIEPPTHDTDEVPEIVLDELSAAFADRVDYDFDDPNIDRLLGIGEESADESADEPSAVEQDADEPAAEEPAADEPLDGESADAPSAEPDREPADPEPTVAEETPRKVIIIEETDQPDAVYLDDEAEQRLREVHGSAERSTIVISDLDQGVGTEQPPSRTPSMDPRVRDRRVAVGKAKSRRRMIWGGAIAAVVLVIVGVLALLGSKVFDVRDVRVQGAVYSSPAIQPILDSVLGKPVLLVDTQDIERQLEATPWVERAKVSTDFPHGLDVDIRERVPLAYFVGSDGGVRIIDRDGRVVEILSGGIPAEVVELVGTHPDTAVGQMAGAIYASAATLAKGLPPQVRNLLTSIAVDPTNNELALNLRAEGTQLAMTVRLGTPDDLTVKIARLLQAFEQGVEGITTIDVSTEEVSQR